MPTRRLRKRLLDRLVKGAATAGELGLALLMTAGVVHCGGDTETSGGDGSVDGAPDHGLAIEAAQEAGPTFEAAVFPEAGSDGHPFPMVEAPAPPPDAGAPPADAGLDAHGLRAEAGIPDAGSDGHPSPMVEAPAPPPEAGPDAHGPLIEAAVFPDAGHDGNPFPLLEAPFVPDL
jgi:hypothetical protein